MNDKDNEPSTTQEFEANSSCKNKVKKKNYLFYFLNHLVLDSQHQRLR